MVGCLLVRAGRFEEALPELLTAAKASTARTRNISNAYTRYFLAMTYWHLGQSDEARQWLARANATADEELKESNFTWN